MITYRYDAYGNTTKSNNTLNNPYQYNAEYTDSSTGLQYLRARYYDSSQGRFTTKDSVYGFVQLPITFNPYTYVCNNPLNFIDPSGRFFKQIFGVAAGAGRAVWEGVGGVFKGQGLSGFERGWNKGKSDGNKSGAKWDSGVKKGATAVNDFVVLMYNVESMNQNAKIQAANALYVFSTGETVDTTASRARQISNYNNTIDYYTKKLKNEKDPNKRKTYQALIDAATENKKALCDEQNNAFMNLTHSVLDLIGFVPCIGAFADSLNAVLYLAQGDLLNAGLSAVSASTEFVDLAKLFRPARYTDNIADIAKYGDDVADAAKHGDDLVDITKKTGTVWDDVKATDKLINGTDIPKSFEMATANGNKFWVHPNATKHMSEYLTRDFMTSSHINNQELLRSFQSAVNAATKNGISYGKLINVGGWELKFSIREGDKLPVIIHALYRP